MLSLWLLNCLCIDCAGIKCQITGLPASLPKNHWKEGGPQNTALLELPVSQSDQLPPHICSKCMNRVVTLERACVDLEDFKKSARACMQAQAHQSLKRPKQTAGDSGVSPSTIKQRPRSKVARRLRFSSK